MKSVKMQCVSFGLSLMAFVGMCNTNVFAQEGMIYGDADGSGTLTSNDAALVEYKAENRDFKLPVEGVVQDYIKYLDVDGDGELGASDSACIYQKVLNDELIFPAENNDKVRLVIDRTGWAYPNVAFWSLAGYPEDAEHNYIVTLYKNDVALGDYTVQVEPALQDGLYYQTGRVGAHIDFTDIIEEDISGAYTFSVRAVGDGITTQDSDTVINRIPYIYNDPSDGDVSVSLASDNTIQVKVNNAALPYQWSYSVDNENIRLVSDASAPEYNAYYDYEPDMPGNAVCSMYNYRAVKPGEVTISFEYTDAAGNGQVLDSKTIRLVIDEDMNVHIAEDGV